MRLVRFGPPGRERPGVLTADGGGVLDVSTLVADYDARFFGEGGIAYLHGALARRSTRDGLTVLPRAGLRLGPPLCRPAALLAAGVNYPMHSRETGVDPPERPVLFAKATSALSGPNDPIVMPRGRGAVDFEVELAFVVGRRLKDAGEDEARSAIAGYLILNDVSEREVQKKGGLRQWFKGKSFDTFAPVGPWIATADEVADPHALDLELTLNGSTMQRSNTREMIFRCETLLAAACDGMTLEPGDLISTGTPDGVGFTRDPPRYLRPGDRLTLAVTGLGEQEYGVVAAAEDGAP